MHDDGHGDRDARGRWKKGFCPNPSGRPRKKPPISDADVNHFRTGAVTLTLNGEKRVVSRHEALMHALFDQALKGKSLIARMLFKRFEDSDELYAKARMELKDIGKAILKKRDEKGEYDEQLIHEYVELSDLLNGGEPRRAPKPPRSRAKPKPPVQSTWRKGPKPQSLIELEKQEEAELLAEERERARRLGLPSPDDANDDDEGPLEF
jgi:Family of unknown function (DUF5681)